MPEGYIPVSLLGLFSPSLCTGAFCGGIPCYSCLFPFHCRTPVSLLDFFPPSTPVSLLDTHPVPGRLIRHNVDKVRILKRTKR